MMTNIIIIILTFMVISGDTLSTLIQPKLESSNGAKPTEESLQEKHRNLYHIMKNYQGKDADLLKSLKENNALQESLIKKSKEMDIGRNNILKKEQKNGDLQKIKKSEEIVKKPGENDTDKYGIIRKELKNMDLHDVLAKKSGRTEIEPDIIREEQKNKDLQEGHVKKSGGNEINKYRVIPKTEKTKDLHEVFIKKSGKERDKYGIIIDEERKNKNSDKGIEKKNDVIGIDKSCDKDHENKSIQEGHAGKSSEIEIHSHVFINKERKNKDAQDGLVKKSKEIESEKHGIIDDEKRNVKKIRDASSGEKDENSKEERGFFKKIWKNANTHDAEAKNKDSCGKNYLNKEGMEKKFTEIYDYNKIKYERYKENIESVEENQKGKTDRRGVLEEKMLDSKDENKNANKEESPSDGKIKDTENRKITITKDESSDEIKNNFLLLLNWNLRHNKDHESVKISSPKKIPPKKMSLENLLKIISPSTSHENLQNLANEKPKNKEERLETKINTDGPADTMYKIILRKEYKESFKKLKPRLLRLNPKTDDLYSDENAKVYLFAGVLNFMILFPSANDETIKLRALAKKIYPQLKENRETIISRDIEEKAWEQFKTLIAPESDYVKLLKGRKVWNLTINQYLENLSKWGRDNKLFRDFCEKRKEALSLTEKENYQRHVEKIWKVLKEKFKLPIEGVILTQEAKSTNVAKCGVKGEKRKAEFLSRGWIIENEIIIEVNILAGPITTRNKMTYLIAFVDAFEGERIVGGIIGQDGVEIIINY